jgi:hypothetical protein
MTGEAGPATAGHGQGQGYTLRISRLTIDKLGVRLYDRASAVVAELVANGHDADAADVWVELPLSTLLSGNDPETGELYEIVVRDNGHGMTPDEARRYYLEVGRDRRKSAGQGDRSRHKDRPVMGRKGIGKLAPFGICKEIEVISSGGNLLPGSGYLTTHFFLDFDKILQDTDTDVELDVGSLDGTYGPQSGTTIRLTSFLPKRVPGAEDFDRQLAVRFAFVDPEFRIHVRNIRAKPPVDSDIKQFQVEVNPDTRIDVSGRPVATEDGRELPVKGWVAMARQSHKNQEGAGVRIYARGKIVATTRDFEQPAGFTGEYTMRSYLVGEVEANWLDDEEDLIRTDRQAILWDSDLGSALRAWGAQIIKEVAKKSAGPRREKKRDEFLEKSGLKEKASARYEDSAVVEEAMDLGEQIGAFAAEDELDDPDYIDGLTEIILSVAPHRALVEAFKAIAKKKEATIEELITLFGKTKLAEMASYAQIAAERVATIHTLDRLINGSHVPEAELQALISSAPWLIKPDWSIITANQQLRTFRGQLVQFFKNRYGKDIDIAVSYETKRPDFTLIQHGYRLHVVELKAPRHAFNDADYERLQNYVVAFEEFFKANALMAASFPEGWQIDLITDSVNLQQTSNVYAFSSFIDRRLVVKSTWVDFLQAAVTTHEQILEVYNLASAGNQAP